MNNKFQRMIDRIIGIPLCALLSLINRMLKKTEPSSPPKHILIILLSEMGSLVLAYPMFKRLKEQYPGASLHILSFSKHRELITLLDVMPEENILTLNEGSLFGFFSDSIHALRRLRSIPFDVVIDCELFSRVSSILSYLSGAKLHVGFHRHTQEGLYRGSFINRPVIYNPYHHLTRQLLNMVDAIESSTMPSTKVLSRSQIHHPPLVVLPEEERAQFFASFERDFPLIKNKKLVLIYPSGGLLPTRAWPMAHYCQLTTELIADGYAVGVIGLQEDKALGQQIVNQAKSPYCIDLTGYTKSLKELLILFHKAALLIANDGGPGHFAALTKVPSLIFFGPETPLLYQPLGEKVYSFYLSLPCSPCLTAYNHRASPCDGDNQCLKQITPTVVIAKARDVLGYSVEPVGAVLID